jgi:DNA repair exonuclease SbcCD nuclease subunit
MFPEEAQRKLTRARLDVVSTILNVARRQSVHAILCAGDIFDDPNPVQDFWEGLLKLLRDQTPPPAPLFFVPGNHDPFTAESVWASHHPFRMNLPSWVHVVDREDFTYDLTPEAVLYARPCRSKAGENDLAMALPCREPADARIRVGCVHGCTFDIDGYQTNFPIARDAGVLRGLTYLAIGDTHSFRDVTPGSSVPTVYPGAPEPTSFDEPEAGSVALVALFRHGLRPRVSPERVAFWRWVDVKCRDLNELRALLTKPELERHVVRLHLEMAVSVAEESEVERIVRELQGTDAAHGRAGIIIVDRSGLRLVPGSIDIFPENLPPVVKTTIDKLDRVISDSDDEQEKEIATRALAHLYKMLQTTEDEVGRLP